MRCVVFADKPYNSLLESVCKFLEQLLHMGSAVFARVLVTLLPVREQKIYVEGQIPATPPVSDRLLSTIAARLLGGLAGPGPANGAASLRRDKYQIVGLL